MAKPTGALLAFGASGQIAKTVVYASWRGVQYARRYLVPANPQSVEQTKTRSAFAWLQAVWKLAPTLFQDVWTLFASGQPFTNRNAFGSKNIFNLRNAANLSTFVFSPGAKGGVAPSSMVITPGAGQLSIAITAPTAPTGWTLTSAIAAAIRDQDPNTGAFYNITAGEDLTSPYTVVLTGLTAGSLYFVGAWLKWLKPDGTIAYSVNISGSSTPT